jgi:mRNA interferase RelE/StbE
MLRWLLRCFLLASRIAICYSRRMKKVGYTDDALKDLRRYRDVAARLRKVLGEYAVGDGAHVNQVTQLIDREEKRLRVGSWRIIFAEDAISITVIRIAPRGRAYE